MGSPEFDRAIPIVLRFEGGYVNLPSDPGGETKYGISKRAFPNLDIKALTVAQAKDIYFTVYWTPLRCDELSWPLGLFAFDCCVNSGPKRAARFLAETRDPAAYLDLREAFYRRLGLRHPDFLRGWLRRVAVLRDLLTAPR